MNNILSHYIDECVLHFNLFHELVHFFENQSRNCFNRTEMSVFELSSNFDFLKIKILDYPVTRIMTVDEYMSTHCVYYNIFQAFVMLW